MPLLAMEMNWIGRQAKRHGLWKLSGHWSWQAYIKREEYTCGWIIIEFSIVEAWALFIASCAKWGIWGCRICKFSSAIRQLSLKSLPDPPPQCWWWWWCNADSIKARSSHKSHRTSAVNKIAWHYLMSGSARRSADNGSLSLEYLYIRYSYASPTSTRQSDTPHCIYVDVFAFWSWWSEDRGGTCHNITVLMPR